MEFYEVAKLIFLAIPEFEEVYDEELNSDYYNSFLGDFGLFASDLIKNKNHVGIKCLTFINDLVNENLTDQDLLGKICVNVLEILTDYVETQNAAIKYFNGQCLSMFEELLNNGFYNNLTG